MRTCGSATRWARSRKRPRPTRRWASSRVCSRPPVRRTSTRASRRRRGRARSGRWWSCTGLERRGAGDDGAAVSRCEDAAWPEQRVAQGAGARIDELPLRAVVEGAVTAQAEHPDARGARLDRAKRMRGDVFVARESFAVPMDDEAGAPDVVCISRDPDVVRAADGDGLVFVVFVPQGDAEVVAVTAQDDAVAQDPRVARTGKGHRVEVLLDAEPERSPSAVADAPRLALHAHRQEVGRRSSCSRYEIPLRLGELLPLVGSAPDEEPIPGVCDDGTVIHSR